MKRLAAPKREKESVPVNPSLHPFSYRMLNYVGVHFLKPQTKVFALKSSISSVLTEASMVKMVELGQFDDFPAQQKLSRTVERTEKRDHQELTTSWRVWEVAVRRKTCWSALKWIFNSASAWNDWWISLPEMIRSSTPFPLVSLFFMFIGFVLSNIGHIRPHRTILAFVSGIFFILSGIWFRFLNDVIVVIHDGFGSSSELNIWSSVSFCPHDAQVFLWWSAWCCTSPTLTTKC